MFRGLCTIFRELIYCILYEQTNKMHFCMYLFYNPCTTVHVSNDYFVRNMYSCTGIVE